MRSINGYEALSFWGLLKALFDTTTGHTHNGTDSKAIAVPGSMELADGKVWVGNGAGAATAVTPSGDVTWTNAGVTAIGSKKVTKAKMAIYISAERTATGSEETVAHGLGATPANVVVVPTDTSPATAGVFTVTEGTHTSTNVLVTVTTGKKYKIIAIA